MHNKIKKALQNNWKENEQKKKRIEKAIYKELKLYQDEKIKMNDDKYESNIAEILNIIESQEEYDM